MILRTSDIMDYLASSQPTASKFKKEVLKHVGKRVKYITLSDLCNYENISISEALKMMGKETNPTAKR